MQRILMLVLGLSLVMTGLLHAQEKTEEGFVPLFDGKTLTDWEGDLNIFRIENGEVVAGSLETPIPRNEFLCTRREYGDFELRLQAKLTGPGDNAGIQFRTRRIPNHHEVSGYQCDMGSAFGRKIWGALYDESRRKKILAEGPQPQVLAATRSDDWNDFIIRAEGDRIRIWLNGVLTVDYREKEEVERSGIIGLQIHGGKPAEVRYRKLRIKDSRKAI